MSAFTAGINGLLKALADRLTPARAANLDNLDAASSTLAPASTALSTANWPNDQSTMVDSVNRGGGGYRPSQLARGPYYAASVPLVDIYGGMSPAWGVFVTTLSGAGSASWESVVNVTSQAGVMWFLAAACNGPGANPDWEMRITVDGVQRFNQANQVESAGKDVGFSIVGCAHFNGITGEFGGLSFVPMRFYSSLLVEVKRNTDTTNVKVAYRTDSVL